MPEDLKKTYHILGPENARLIKSVLPHVDYDKPAILNLSPYLLNGSTKILKAEMHISKHKTGYKLTIWRKQQQQQQQQQGDKIIKYPVSSSRNVFQLDQWGTVLKVRDNSKTIADPVGVNLFSCLLFGYHFPVRRAMNKVLFSVKHEPKPIEYKFKLKNHKGEWEIRHKTGTIYYNSIDGTLIFDVRRITPQEKRKSG